MRPSDSKYDLFNFTALGLTLCICLIDSADAAGVVYPALLKKHDTANTWEQIARRPDLDLTVQTDSSPFSVLIDIVDNFNIDLEAISNPVPLTFNEEVAKLLSTRLGVLADKIVLVS